MAFFVARLSDRFGRRPTLLWSVVGYTLFTRPHRGELGHLVLRPVPVRQPRVPRGRVRHRRDDDRRGVPRRTAGPAPSARCSPSPRSAPSPSAILLGAGLQDTSLDWRAFYLVGLLPLLILSVFRRRLKETQRFEEVRAGHGSRRTPSRRCSSRGASEYRKNLLLVGLAHMFRSIPLYGSTAWWAFYAERERGFSSNQVAIYIICAYGLGCLGYYICGRAMERFGRRPTAIVYAVGSHHLLDPPLPDDLEGARRSSACSSPSSSASGWRR